MAQPFLRLANGDNARIVKQTGIDKYKVRVRIVLPDGTREWRRLSRAELKDRKFLKSPPRK